MNATTQEGKLDMKHGSFDNRGFYEALDSTRQARNLNWKQVAAQSGVSG